MLWVARSFWINLHRQRPGYLEYGHIGQPGRAQLDPFPELGLRDRRVGLVAAGRAHPLVFVEDPGVRAEFFLERVCAVEGDKYSAPRGMSLQTFWWGRGSHEPYQYFDVFIAPKQPIVKPLIEVKREFYHDPNPNKGIVLVITLQNDNDTGVEFVANHVRIYP